MLRALLFVSALIPALVLPLRSATAQPAPPFPRLANAYWAVGVDSAVIAALAKWDVVVLNSVWTDAQLAGLRQLNPNIRIYFYVIVYTLELPPASGDPWKLETYQHAADNDLWWYDKNGGIGSDWPNTQMCNVTDLGPVGPQGQWKQYIASRIEQLVSAHPLLDGIFLDNYWKGISWQQGLRQLDSDCNPTHNPAGCDGVADSNTRLDSLWNDALREIAADLRARFDVLQPGRERPLAILTNNATDYYESLNGAMIEYFPSGHSNVDYDNVYGYNWNQEILSCPGGYLVAPFLDVPYTFQVLNGDWIGSTWEPARNPEFERHKRFTLVSSLLGEGYYSLDAGAADGHGNLWWEPEYDHAGRGKGWLGQPLGAMVRLLEPTGAEILQNGSFTNGTAGWNGFPFGGTGTFGADTTTFHSAPAAARAVVTSVDPGGEYKIWQGYVPLVHHQAYTLSFWARSTVPQPLAIHLYSEQCPGFRCWKEHGFCLEPEWQRFEMSFTSNGTASAGLNIFVRAPSTVWLDDVSLRTGDTSLFRRDFDQSVALLNYTNVNQTVDLGGVFWRPKVPGSVLWDGARVTQEVIPPSDARIVLRDSVPDLPDTTGVSDAPPTGPARAQLRQNEPNPFNPSTVIAFALDREELASLAIYDVAGRLVRTLFQRRRFPAGIVQRVRWDGADDAGRRVPSGVYLYRLTTPTLSQTRKMALLE